MTTLFFYTLTCNFHWVFILVFLTSLWGSDIGDQFTLSYRFVMPVITRSRANILKDSIDGHLATTSFNTSIRPTDGRSESSTINISTGSTDGPSTEHPSSSRSTDELSFLDQQSSSASRFTSITTLSSVRSLSSTPTIPVDNFEFEISKHSESFENSKQHSLTDSTTLVHTVSRNSQISNYIKMEDDCDDSASSPKMPSSPIDVQQLFASFTNQLTTHMEHLQAQMMANDMKVSAAQEVFQQQVKSEMDSLQQLVGNQQYSTVPQVSTPNSVPTPVSSSTVTPVL
jgi:hypothetical protein